MTHITPRSSDAAVLTLDDYDVLPSKTTGAGIRGYIAFGILVIGLFVGGATYWATASKLDGAVVAPGSFVVDGNRKTVDHLEGGIVRNILVRDGDVVTAGQPLLELESNDLDVDLDVLKGQLGDRMIRRAYLLAQITGADTFDEATARSTFDLPLDRSDWYQAYVTQKSLFDAERQTKASEDILRLHRISTLEAQIAGLSNQRAANTRQLDITMAELENLETLFDKGLTTAQRLNDRRIDIERLGGLDATIQTELSQARNQIEELKLTALAQDQERIQGSSSELVALESELATLKPQFGGAQRQQKQLVVTAPVSGRVVGMTVFTNGGVVRPGAPILDIVPADEDLVVEARVRTVDVDKLFVGQQTRVRLSGFGQSDIPEAVGTIINVSADSLEDERTGETYYSAKIGLSDMQSQTVENLQLVPGMPADVFINTGERTALTYLVQPIQDRLARTFVE